MNLARLLAVARGDEEPDLVVAGARVFCAFTREWVDADVAVAEGRVASVGTHPGGDERVDATGRFLVPGFVDAHVHIESSKLLVDEWARTIARHGTTAAVVDPHEIANVLGPEGVHWIIDACDDAALPVDIFVMAPSSVPASEFESPRTPFAVDDIAAILERPRAIGIAEMMNFPGVVTGEAHELAKLDVPGGVHVDGHAPGVLGRELDAYAATGIATDHECTTVEEALARRRRGMWVLMREASNARNLVDLLPLVREHGTDFTALCTDDREPDFLLREGSVNQMLRSAVANGVGAEDALVLATLNGARCHGLRGHGAIAPGYHANLALLDDLVSFRPRTVWSRGRDVATLAPHASTNVPRWVRDSVHVQPVTPETFAIPEPSGGGSVRVIGLVPGQLLTNSLVEQPTVVDGHVVGDAERDLAKIAVIERHHATGRVGLGLVRGFGLRTGGFATTVAHDAHNLVAVGTRDEDLAACVARLAEIGGGIVVSNGGAVVEELALPVAGLLSDQPVEHVVERLESLTARLRELGVTPESPFMTLSFLALSVIPSLKITDRGLVDVDRFELVPLAIGTPTPVGA